MIDVGGAQRVLVVEDDRAIADALTRRLVSEGFLVHSVHDGQSAVDAAALAERSNEPYDIVVLDVMLPRLDGLEVCRRIQSGRPVPVLMLTARDTETDRIVGLGVGADDYLTKPFSPRELVARVRALLRRVDRAAELAERAGSAKAASGDDAVLDLGGGAVLDVSARTLLLDGAPVHLTRTEFDLLHALARRPGHVITREQLLADVWSWESPGDSGLRAADSHVKSLRRKLGGERIRTVHGVGYALAKLP